MPSPPSSRPPVPAPPVPAPPPAARPFAPAALIAGLAAAAAAGCGPSLEEYPTAPAGGVVTCGGTPLGSGRVLFSPVPAGNAVEAGKQARGYILEEGRFTLSTYGDGDGAVVGEHRVFVESVEGGDLGECSGKVERTVTVTTDGPNEFTFDLPPASARRPARGEDDEDEDD